MGKLFADLCSEESVEQLPHTTSSAVANGLAQQEKNKVNDELEAEREAFQARLNKIKEEATAGTFDRHVIAKDLLDLATDVAKGKVYGTIMPDVATSLQVALRVLLRKEKAPAFDDDLQGLLYPRKRKA